MHNKRESRREKETGNRKLRECELGEAKAVYFTEDSLPIFPHSDKSPKTTLILYTQKKNKLIPSQQATGSAVLNLLKWLLLDKEASFSIGPVLDQEMSTATWPPMNEFHITVVRRWSTFFCVALAGLFVGVRAQDTMCVI